MSRALDFVLETGAADLPEAVRDAARRHLLDTLGVAAAARDIPMARAWRDHAAALFGAGEGAGAAALWFDGRRASAAGVAMAMAGQIDALDAHDGHRLTKGHVGCGLVAGLLAVAEAEGATADFDALLTLLAIGYEIGTRAGVALHATAAEYHTSGAWISIAVSAVAGRLMGLSPAQIREAMGVAEYHGPRSPMMRCIDHPTMVKDGSAWGALAGVSAAYLARAGFTGAPAETVEGQRVAAIWSDLGERWTMTEQYVKAWPVCRWAQPAVEAALALRAAHGLDPAAITRVEIATFHEAKRLAVAHPRSTEEAQYALPWPVAAALVRGAVGAAEVSEAALGDVEIRRLAAVVAVTEDDACNAAFPAQRYARVVVTLASGARFESALTAARGDPEAPLDAAAIRAKFDALTTPALGAERAAALAAATAGASGRALFDALAPI